MKNILKFLMLTMILFVTQQTKAQVKFGIQGGVGLSDAMVGIQGGGLSEAFSKYGSNKSLNEDELKTKNILAFQLGAVVDFSLSESLSLKSGLLYSRKGFRSKKKNLGLNEYTKFQFSYLEVPFHLVYKINKFQTFAGPYFAYGLAGVNKWKLDGESDSETYKPTTKTISLDDKKNYFNAIDYGLNFGVGYQVGPILLNAGYSFGIGNIQPKHEDILDIMDIELIMNYRSFSLSGIYFFGDNE